MSSVETKLLVLVDELNKVKQSVATARQESSTVSKQIGPKGEKGDKGDSGPAGTDGANGKDGKDGIDGKDGVSGKDGISVVDASVDFDNSLVLKLSDGNIIDAGSILLESVKQEVISSYMTRGEIIPSQDGQTGKYLKTVDGTLEWATVAGGGGANGVYTNGSYADPTWITSLSGSKVSGNITGNAANVTNTVAVANGGTGQTTYTDGQLLIGNTTGNTLDKATLTAGVGVSITNGAGSITIASLLAKSTSVFTSGSAQTYTAPANTQWVKVTVVGPGGNGGGANSQRATGGGGGAVAIKWLTINAGQTLTYTVGTSSGTASSVSSGTLSITTISAGSGSNGAGTAYANSSTAGPVGGTATGGDVNMNGGRGGHSFGSSTTVATNFSGKGGDCPGFGSGGPNLGSVATAGIAGTGFGAGGGGSHGNNTAASGTSGIIIFEAY